MTSSDRPQPPGRDALLKQPIVPTLARLAAPNAISMVAAAAVSIAETAYVGRMGVAALAGITLVFPLMMLMQMMSAGAMGGGISGAVSRAMGAGDSARVDALALCALTIGAVAGCGGLVLLLTAGPVVFRALGGEGAALSEALAYSGIAAFGILFIWLTNVQASVLRGVGRMGIPAAVIVIACVIQIGLGAALGFGFGPAPRLGVAGIALGQTIAFAATSLILFVVLRAGRGVRLRFDLHALQPALFADILRVGAVGCLSPILAVLSVLVLTSLAARFGPEALAGYGIGTRLEFLLIPLAFSIGVASVPLVGVAIGAGDVARARRVAWSAGAAAAVLLSVVALVMMIAPGLWAGLFTANPTARATAELYLRIAAIGFPFFGLGLCLYFASQGAGRVGGPIAAQGARFAAVLAGGAALQAMQAPLWMVFALVAVSMAILGLGSALAIRLTPWGPRATAATAPA